VVTERPRIALRQPRSLQPEQMGQLTVCTPAIPQSVSACLDRVGGRRWGTRAGICGCLDQEGGPGQVRSPTASAWGVGLGWGGREGL